MEMNCQACKDPFNLSNRKPLFTSCCNETVCTLCFQKMLEQGSQDSFQCLICSERSKIDVQFMPIKTIERKLRDQFNIQCSAHPNNQAIYYCKTDKKLACSTCIFNDHSNHAKEVIELKREQINDYNEIISNKLESAQQRIIHINSKIQTYQKSEQQLKSDEYQNIIKDAEIIMEIDSKIEEQKQPNPSFHTFITSTKIDPQNPQEQIQNHNIDSILLNQDDCKLIEEWVGKKCAINLIYRGSRDGFKVDSSSPRFIGKQNTIHVIKSEHGKIFGGYCSIQWEQQQVNEVWKSDSNAFVFSITHKTKHIQYERPENAIDFHKSFICWFGYGGCVGIYDNCDQISTNSAHFDYVYKPPDGIQKGSNIAKNYLAGAQNYKVVEYEAFQLIFQ